MSYAIATIVYGVPVTDKIVKLLRTWKDEGDERYYEDNDGFCGFTGLYSSSGEEFCGYCGIELDEFDEACDFVDPTKLKMKPDKAQMKVADEFIKNLDPEIRELCEPVGVYFVWNSS